MWEEGEYRMNEGKRKRRRGDRTEEEEEYSIV
jgi:hypothetical protein